MSTYCERKVYFCPCVHDDYSSSDSIRAETNVSLRRDKEKHKTLAFKKLGANFSKNALLQNFLLKAELSHFNHLVVELKVAAMTVKTTNNCIYFALIPTAPSPLSGFRCEDLLLFSIFVQHK